MSHRYVDGAKEAVTSMVKDSRINASSSMIMKISRHLFDLLLPHGGIADRQRSSSSNNKEHSLGTLW